MSREERKMATFEERLTKLRTKAGVSQQAIRPSKSGRFFPLADYFDVSLDYLVGRSDRRERNP